MPTIIPIHSFYKAKIIFLISIKIFAKYSDFSNIFSANSVIELLEYNKVNNHSINLFNNKQLFYSLIYRLRLIKLQILKTYTRADLAISFIRYIKSFAVVLVLFIQKKDNSLCLYVNYLGLNNLIIKNQYLLPFIYALPNCLGCSKYFI